MAATLYEPAFAVLAKWFERGRGRALLLVTLAGGLASTIFLPLSAWLVGVQGWRGALLALAVLLALFTIVPHALVLRRRPERSEEHTSELQSRQYLVCRLLLEKNQLLAAYHSPVR